MNWKLWLCVIMGVAVAHVAFLLFIFHFKTLGQPYVPPPKPTFESRTITYVDEKGKPVEKVQEFKISTAVDEKKP